jgi:peptidoglycan/LPS O-acetylase OafA/YrhL
VRQPARYPHVDGLRAIAALSVVVFHIGFVAHASHAGFVNGLRAQALSGVTVFFVISGFLLYRPFVAANWNAHRPDVAEYAKRRARRILPGYWAVLVVIGLLGLPGAVFGAHWWEYFAFMQIYDNASLFGGLAVAWTLCVEVSFYALLPLYALVLRRLVAERGAQSSLRIELAALVGLSLVALLTKALLLPRLPTGSTVVASTLPMLFPWFALGMSLAVLGVAEDAGVASRLPALVRRHPLSLWAAAAALYAVAVFVAPAGVTYLPEYGWFAMTLLGVIAAMLVAPAAFPPQRSGAVHRFLECRPMVWLGVISYGIYLWHLPAMTWLYEHGVHGLAYVTIAALGAIALGAASFCLIERRFLSQGSNARRIAPVRLSPPEEAATPAQS